jgi:hypothetical protein
LAGYVRRVDMFKDHAGAAFLQEREYYGRYTPSALHPMLRYVNLTLLAWAMRNKRFSTHKIRASHFLQRLVRN